MDIQFLIAFFSYTAALITIGIIIYRKQKSSSEFMVGDRSINYWVTAIATHATDMSAWLFMAYPGIIYQQGMIGTWNAIFLIICMFLSWHFIAKRLRVATEKYDCSTLSSYFEKRFNDKSGTIRLVATTVALVFFTFYISAGIVALGRALGATFGFSYHTGIILGTLTVSLYTVLGGFVAVAWNDFFQGMFVLFVIIGFPIYAIFNFGGPSAVLASLQQQNVTLNLIPSFSLSSLTYIFVPAFAWGMGYFGQPHILVNFMGIDNPDNIKKAKRIGISWQIIAMSCATLIGLLGAVYFKAGTHDSELVFIDLVKALCNPLLAGLILCAILAAAISTMDSQILVSASMLSEDIYKKAFHKNISSKNQLLVSRLSGISITLLSFYIAFDNSESIWALVRYAWYGLGSSFGALVILSLYSKKINKYGALAGIMSGCLTAFIWQYLPTPIPEYSIIPGFPISFFSILFFSKLTRR